MDKCHRSNYWHKSKPEAIKLFQNKLFLISAAFAKLSAKNAYLREYGLQIWAQYHMAHMDMGVMNPLNSSKYGPEGQKL